MAEYIEREQVKDELLSWAVCIKHPEHLLKEDALCVIDAIPAADVVPVVRCKDCRFYEMGVEYYGGGTKDVCRLIKCQMQTDDFCSYGERRDSNGDL